MNEITSPSVQLPVNFITIGKVEKDDLKVYIKQDIFNYIEKYSTSNKDKELGGVLLGEYIEEMDSIYVIISDFIEAKYTDSTSSSLTFTHKTWEYIYNEQNNLYPTKKILGWQHTHPGYGIFLSNHDMFIQKNFFNLPWQIAYVIDPVNFSKGFFQWKDNKVVNLEGFYIYDDVNKKIKIPEILTTKEKSDLKIKKINVSLSVITIILLISLIFTSILNSKLKYNLSATNLKLNNTQIELDTIKNLSISQDVMTNNDNLVIFQKYKIKSGDTIIEICEALGIDYEKNINVIKGLNGIDDPNNIMTGNTIIMPIKQ